LSVEGIEEAAVSEWIAARAEVARPLRFERVAGGRSNLTYAVTAAAGARFALRRPPLGGRQGSAHDVAREFRVMDALSASPVPVPPLVGLCEDEDVTGAPFYVMGFVDGPILRSPADAERDFPELGDRAAVGLALVDALADLHAVDPAAIGLAELGRPDAYVERQLRRWSGQWEKSKTRELPAIDAVHASLAARVPTQGSTAIVHGDYRLDNVILTPAGAVAAVLDWELCTLGDPLADLGLLLVYWSEPGDGFVPLTRPATVAPGFPTRGEIVARYAARSGRDVGAIDYYVALGYWKLAVILEGVYARLREGQYGAVDDDVERFRDAVDTLATAAEDTVARLTETP
jgi:aminoglycoside phosphotransferase (APT) family kinase protein